MRKLLQIAKTHLTLHQGTAYRDNNAEQLGKLSVGHSPLNTPTCNKEPFHANKIGRYKNNANNTEDGYDARYVGSNPAAGKMFT